MREIPGDGNKGFMKRRERKKKVKRKGSWWYFAIISPFPQDTNLISCADGIILRPFLLSLALTLLFFELFFLFSFSLSLSHSHQLGNFTKLSKQISSFKNIQTIIRKLSSESFIWIHYIFFLLSLLFLFKLSSFFFFFFNFFSLPCNNISFHMHTVVLYSIFYFTLSLSLSLVFQSL